MAVKKTTRKPKNNKSPNYENINNFAYFFIGLFFLSTYFTSNYDNSIGLIGSWLFDIFKGLFGDVLFFVSIFLMFIGVYGLLSRNKPKRTLILGVVLSLFGLFIAFQIQYIDSLSIDTILKAFDSKIGGGLFGALVANSINYTFGNIGIWIVMFSFFLIGIALIINNVAMLKKIRDASAQKINEIQEDMLIKKDLVNKRKQIEKVEKKKEKRKNYENQILTSANLNRDDFTEEEIKSDNEQGRTYNIKDHGMPVFNPEHNDPKKIKQTTIKDDESNEMNKRIRNSAHFHGKWQLPPTTLLKNIKKDKDYSKKIELENTARLLENTLRSFGIKIQVKDINCGPSITRYEAVLEPGTKVSKINGLSEDIALALAATSVRIEAPIPGKSAVGFEIPNKKVIPVTFKEVILSSIFKDDNSPLIMGIGKDITGRTVATSLVDMPHLLIAGSTGSGKSVCLNTIICSLLYKYTPDELKFLLIDPKKVELNLYNDIPHLVAPVVTEPKKAAVALKWMVNEMENRYQILSDLGVKDIKSYNNVVKNEEKLPYVVIIIDELADLMMAAPVEVETYICRIAQKARAAGLHLIVATQRPSVQVITGDIKSNIPTRIAFAVFSQIDARTILDSVGAEKLLGKGDMLFTEKGGKLKRIQGAYISEEEIIEITKFLKAQGKPEYLQGVEILEKEDAGESSDKKNTVSSEDELLSDAARLILESGQASISMLQRKLRIGYSRAARLIDMLEEKGLVGPFEGTKSREVVGNWEDFGRLFGE
ncbi:MAG: DNA segregation ATPase FtsK/SpoIIIE S-DNA-T family [Fusobacteria bacterium]|nr:MAG: DNA segregation ATPase FtsK/SpoIIIE S-DNA-T family [Fusobacteriota bacterium]KAF0229885.1 MAG: DNA segregation ATPase FtsK/SpoIIIE S-DNA-T [Fusobacteriota bacterium]